MDEMEVDHVIKVTLTNEILKRISEIVLYSIPLGFTLPQIDRE